jgi:hypothetical protein
MNLLYSSVTAAYHKMSDLLLSSSFTSQSLPPKELEERNFHEALRQTLLERNYQGSIVQTHPIYATTSIEKPKKSFDNLMLESPDLSIKQDDLMKSRVKIFILVFIKKFNNIRKENHL